MLIVVNHKSYIVVVVVIVSCCCVVDVGHHIDIDLKTLIFDGISHLS